MAHRIARVLADIPGASGVQVEQVEGVPVLGVEVDRAAVARYGLTVADVQDVVAMAIGGRTAGQVFEGDRRFDLVLRLPETTRADPVALQSLPIPLSHTDDPLVRVALETDHSERERRHAVPLSAVAKLTVSEGPNQVGRENGKRRIVVQTNVRGRDLGSYVEEARTRVAAEVALPPGTWLGWGGQYENLVRAQRRLTLVVPVCFLVIGLLLYGTFGAVTPAAIVFSGVPLALPGGVAALWLRDMPFSISAAVGFIALSGVAVLNGIVLVTFIEQLRAAGHGTEDAILRGAVTRLRPVLMTALVASLGFVPMALAAATGAEVQRPLATVVIGGLVSSTALTLFVLPALYALVGGRGDG